MQLGPTITIQASLTSRLINWKRSTNSRYTNEDQQEKFPDDKGFRFINDLATRKIQWGDGL
jgi:hypothetical protein